MISHPHRHSGRKDGADQLRRASTVRTRPNRRTHPRELAVKRSQGVRLGQFCRPRSSLASSSSVTPVRRFSHRRRTEPRQNRDRTRRGVWHASAIQAVVRGQQAKAITGRGIMTSSRVRQRIIGAAGEVSFTYNARTQHRQHANDYRRRRRHGKRAGERDRDAEHHQAGAASGSCGRREVHRTPAFIGPPPDANIDDAAVREYLNDTASRVEQPGNIRIVVKFPQSRGKALRNELQTCPGVSRTAEYSAALPLERGEAAVRLRVTRSESGVSSVAAAPRSSAASVAEADGSAKG